MGDGRWAMGEEERRKAEDMPALPVVGRDGERGGDVPEVSAGGEPGRAACDGATRDVHIPGMADDGDD